MTGRTFGVLCLFSFLVSLHAAVAKEYLVKFNDRERATVENFEKNHGGNLSRVSFAGNLYRWTAADGTRALHLRDNSVTFIQENHPIRLFANPSIIAHQAEIQAALESRDNPLAPSAPATDNPEIATPPIQASGTDPMLGQAWGIKMTGADVAWNKLPQGKDIVVAVTDTGVDYNHSDLIANMWRNKGEIPGDGIDNDQNGYVDDVVGYDFFANDNKPYDLALSLFEVLLSGGNPGHGTHVAGVVGAKMNNGIGVAGVAPQVSIMALRFISEKGQGDTASAVKAIDYAVQNGANIINASWGSEGEEEGDHALREALQRAADKGVIFVAAAGNGRAAPGATSAAGYDNDTDAKPSYPASYPHANIVSVAALTTEDALAPFSNFGKTTVDIGAPGVKILSTVPGSKFQDTIIELGDTKITWDGTSMASPFVAGGLAVAWSQNKTATWEQVRAMILQNIASSTHLTGKVVTGGRMNLSSLVK